MALLEGSKMKHARPDYNRIQDPANKIPTDEPVFLIRGQDRFGWVVVALYAIIVYLLGQDKELTRMALKQAVEMAAWKKKQEPDYRKKVAEGQWLKPDESGEYHYDATKEGSE